MPSPRPAAWWHAQVGDLLTLSTAEFAARHGVNVNTVLGWRQRLGIPSPVPQGRPKGRGRSPRWAGVDWSRRNVDLARELGVTPEAVRQQRAAAGLPPSRRGPDRKPKRRRS